jgi:hypothetical protein
MPGPAVNESPSATYVAEVAGTDADADGGAVVAGSRSDAGSSDPDEQAPSASSSAAAATWRQAIMG